MSSLQRQVPLIPTAVFGHIMDTRHAPQEHDTKPVTEVQTPDLVRLQPQHFSFSSGIFVPLAEKPISISSPKKTKMASQSILSLSSNQKKAQGMITCHVCGKWFHSRQQLSQHMLVHTDVRKYKCKYCDRAFKQPSHLDQHHRIHTGEKPYKCTLPGCKRAFPQLSNLNHHMRNHNKPEPPAENTCIICDRTYASEAVLKTHIVKIHRCEPNILTTSGNQLRSIVENRLSSLAKSPADGPGTNSEFSSVDNKDIKEAVQLKSDERDSTIGAISSQNLNTAGTKDYFRFYDNVMKIKPDRDGDYHVAPAFVSGNPVPGQNDSNVLNNSAFDLSAVMNNKNGINHNGVRTSSPISEHQAYRIAETGLYPFGLSSVSLDGRLSTGFYVRNTPAPATSDSGLGSGGLCYSSYIDALHNSGCCNANRTGNAGHVYKKREPDEDDFENGYSREDRYQYTLGESDDYDKTVLSVKTDGIEKKSKAVFAEQNVEDVTSRLETILPENGTNYRQISYLAIEHDLKPLEPDQLERRNGKFKQTEAETDVQASLARSRKRKSSLPIKIVRETLDNPETAN